MAVLHDNMNLELIKAFGDALELHLKTLEYDPLVNEVWGENADFQTACEALNHAFDIAERYGWNWEDDMNFSDWCLKATEQEISAEGLRIALAKCNIHEPIPPCDTFIP